MAWYKYPKFITTNQHENFDKLREPGEKTPDAGIYRCEGCGHEIGIAKEHILPPQNHHMHTQSQGAIRWRMIVCAINS